MTTLRQIVIDAFRENGLVQVGTTPDADEFDEALRKVKNIILSLYGNEMGTPLTPQAYGREGLLTAYSRVYDVSNDLSSYYVMPNSQLMVNATDAYTVYLNPMPMDGERFAVVDVAQNFDTRDFTVEANGRRINGDTFLTINTAGANRQWFYRGDLGEWQEVTNLTADSQSPFPQEFDDLLVIMLAMRLHPRHKEQTAQETVEEYRRLRRQFRARYRQSREVYPDIALVRLPSRVPTGAGYDSRWGDNAFTYGEVIIDGGD